MLTMSLTSMQTLTYSLVTLTFSALKTVHKSVTVFPSKATGSLASVDMQIFVEVTVSWKCF